MKQLTVLISALVLSLTVNAQNYFLGTSGDGVEELYIMSVTNYRSNGYTVVFDRIKPAAGKLPEFRSNAVKNADKETDTKSFDKLGYYRRRIQYSCKARKYRVMECTYYDLGGKVLEKVEYKEKNTEWSVLPKGSLIEAEFKKICKK